ncbi:MAG: triphosphoribosyl-dephospho-CoA synthase [Sedimentibacter sp.]
MFRCWRVREDIKNLDKQFIAMNISPGGCADLLAVTYMLYFLENQIKMSS